MRFNLVIKNKEGKEHGAIPPLMLETIRNVLGAHGFEISSLIPESHLGKRMRLMLEAIQRLEYEWGFSKNHHFFKPGYFTIHPGVIIGGPPGPLVPIIVSTYCRIECIVWFPPQEDEESIKAEIEQYLLKAAALDSWLAENPPTFEWRYCWPPFEVEADHPLLDDCINSYEYVAHATPGARSNASVHGFAAVCDATFLTKAGIPTVVYGPGDILLAHHCNEYVSIDDLMLCAKTLASVAIDWCGVA